MDKDNDTIDKSYCERCNKSVVSYDIIYLTNGVDIKEEICLECWNKDIAEAMKLDFEHLKLKPITLVDVEGKSHLFRFQIRLLSLGLFIDAIEFKNGVPMGYRFSIRGECNTNQTDLILDLYEKIKKGLAHKYLEDSKHTVKSIKNSVVCGRIMWDEEFDDSIPKLVIDGEEITWDDFGRMLMTYEGFQFKLQTLDLTEDTD